MDIPFCHCTQLDVFLLNTASQWSSRDCLFVFKGFSAFLNSPQSSSVISGPSIYTTAVVSFTCARYDTASALPSSLKMLCLLHVSGYSDISLRSYLCSEIKEIMCMINLPLVLWHMERNRSHTHQSFSPMSDHHISICRAYWKCHFICSLQLQPH